MIGTGTIYFVGAKNAEQGQMFLREDAGVACAALDGPFEDEFQCILRAEIAYAQSVGDVQLAKEIERIEKTWWSRETNQ